MQRGKKSSLSNNLMAADQLSENTKKRTLSGPNQQLILGKLRKSDDVDLEANGNAENSKIFPENQCPICTEFYTEDEMFGLSCGHLQCKYCIQTNLQCNITEGKVLKIRCMEHECKEVYTAEDIRKFGSQDIYSKYLRFYEKVEVDMNPKLRWCPRPGCLDYI